MLKLHVAFKRDSVINPATLNHVTFPDFCLQYIFTEYTQNILGIIDLHFKLARLLKDLSLISASAHFQD